MSKKITWDMIYADFRKRYPNLKKMVNYWEPCNWMCIRLFMKDGRTLLYDCYQQIAKFE